MSKVLKNKLPRITFSLQEAMNNQACQDGKEKFENYLIKNNIKYNNKTRFSLTLLLKSNSVSDFFWMLKNLDNVNIELSFKLSITVSKNAAYRAGAFVQESRVTNPYNAEMAVEAPAFRSAEYAKLAADCFDPSDAADAAGMAAAYAAYAQRALAEYWEEDVEQGDEAFLAEEQKQIDDILTIIGE